MKPEEAYVPYSGFKVGAAVQLTVESLQAATLKMLLIPYKLRGAHSRSLRPYPREPEFTALAVVADTAQPVPRAAYAGR